MGAYFSSSQPTDYEPTEADATTDQLDLNPANYVNCGVLNTESVPLAELAARSIEEQAKHSDAICRRYAKNPLFREKMAAAPMPTAEDIANINETSIGNMAYMALHSGDQTWVDRHKALIELFKA